ncbi:MAG TPA: nicotinamide-nucleotide adenylyltransferase [Nitrososphaeraceae archaeon]
MDSQIIRGLMVGRFQPFHNGHLYLSNQILQECDELIIAIGSAQFNYIYKDPFTAGERVLMIHAALLESKIDLTRCYVIPIVNDENNARWLAHLRSMVPSFNILYSGNDFVTNLVSREIKIKKPLFSKKDVYNGTNIRKQMARMQNWKKLVPNAVFRVIEEIGGVTRLKTLLKSDSYPQQW